MYYRPQSRTKNLMLVYCFHILYNVMYRGTFFFNVRLYATIHSTSMDNKRTLLSTTVDQKAGQAPSHSNCYTECVSLEHDVGSATRATMLRRLNMERPKPSRMAPAARTTRRTSTSYLLQHNSRQLDDCRVRSWLEGERGEQ